MPESNTKSRQCRDAYRDVGVRVVSGTKTERIVESLADKNGGDDAITWNAMLYLAEYVMIHDGAPCIVQITWL